MATLKPKIPVPERILNYGIEGTGKSTNWLTIARRLPDSKFVVVESDGSHSVERLLATDFTDVAAIGNVTVHNATEWSEWVDGMQHIKNDVGPGDWGVVDLIGPAWDTVQEFWTERKYGKDFDVFLMEHMLSNSKKGNPLDGDKDWSVINRVYRANIANVVSHCKGHVFATSSAAKIGDRDEKSLKDLYASVGVKPHGQKHTGHLFHTVLLSSKTRMGEWRLTTIKDRGRPELSDAPVTSFASDYLVKVAGWRPTRAAA